MTDQGYSVYWDEWNIVDRIETHHRYFASADAAMDFKSSLDPTTNPRIFERGSSDETQREVMKRDKADAQNRRRLVELMLEHNITIPARQFDKWRPTEETTGHIEGVSDGLNCIMTDGLLGYFLRGDREPLLGHVAHFIWDSPTVTLVKYIDEATGEERFTSITTKKGAPPPWAKKEHDEKPKVRKTKPKTPSKRRLLLDSL